MAKAMMTRQTDFDVKICGLSTPPTLEAALAAGADMVGLVFHPRSPRFVSREQAVALAGLARGRAQIVALVVDLPPDAMTDLVATVRPDWLQLHGSETPEQVRAIRAATGVPVMKALGIAETTDLAAIAPYRDVADRILLDARAPKGAAYPGGHGRPFDWTLLRDLDPALRFMLGGGLDPDNVGRAIAVARSSAVDVSSGVESAPGVKDVDRITDFVAAARAAAAAASQEAGRT